MKTIPLIIIALILSTPTAFSQTLEWNSVALYYAKTSPHFNAYDFSNDYIRTFHNKLWKKYRHDEFLLEEKRPSFIKELKGLVSQLDTNEIYTLRTNVDLGQYDFKNGFFPLKSPLTESTYFPMQASRRVNSFPDKFKIFLSNPADIIGMEMERSIAKEFVNSRKSSSGRVDRQVTLVLNLKLNGFKGNDKNNLFEAEIQSYNFDLE